MLKEDNFLGGYVVGIGKQRKDGSFEYRELEKPIHNRIVSQGIDNLLMYQGNDDCPTDARSIGEFLVMGRTENSGANYGRGGVILYSAVGDDNTPTQFTDTDLGNRTSDICHDMSNGNPYCGYRTVGERTVGYRVTHLHTILANGYVREVGWYKDVQGTYELFSRVVFDNAIEVDAGDVLWITYELDFTFPGKSVVTVPGILDSEGNTLYAEVASTRKAKTATSSWTGQDNYCPFYVWNEYPVNGYVRGQTSRSSSGMPNTTWWTPVWSWKMAWNDYSGYTEYARNYPFYVLSTGTPLDFTGNVQSNPQAVMSVDQTNIQFRKILPYTRGSFYRDAVITLGPSWPNLTTEEYVDIAQIVLNGMSYKFGHYDTDPDTGDQVWVPQYYRKRSDKNVAITFRQSFHTADTP